MSNYAKKVDQNQARLVRIFRELGASVFVLHMVGKDFPDAIIGIRKRNILVEFKSPKGKLSEGQEAFFASWRGDVRLVRSDDDVIAIMNELGD